MFCPNCGAERTGAFRFCMSCKFDYDTLSTTTPPKPTGPAPNAMSGPPVEIAPAAVPFVARATDETQQVPVTAVPAPSSLQPGATVKKASAGGGIGGYWRRRSTKGKAAIVGLAVVVGLVAIGSVSGNDDPSASDDGSTIGAVASPTPTPDASPTASPLPDPTTALDTPTPEPTTTTPEPAPAATPKPEYKKLSARNWDKLVKNPDAYLGKTYQVWACISQFDSATGPDTFRAEAANKKQDYWYLASDNAMFTGDADRLADFVKDDVVLMNVTSLGSFSYDTQIGGNTTVPLFSIEKISHKGSCE